MSKKSIYITKNCPLIVYDNSSDMEYDTVVLEKGAYIELRAGTKFSIDKLTRDFPDGINISSFIRISKDTIRSNDLTDWTDDIIVTSAPGESGSPGGNGGYGGDGAGGGGGGNGADGRSGGKKGKARPNMTLIIAELQDDISVLNIGGRGGDGGGGGKGGDGGDGDKDIAGGKGGRGGNGGNGGNGDNGCKLLIRWNSTNESNLTFKDEAAPGGIGGQGGAAGKDGKNITPSGSTDKPRKGKNGKRGKNGVIGKTSSKKK